jgi:hypothetical protein
VLLLASCQLVFLKDTRLIVTFQIMIGTRFTEMLAANDWKPFQSCLIKNSKAGSENVNISDMMDIPCLWL